MSKKKEEKFSVMPKTKNQLDEKFFVLVVVGFLNLPLMTS